MSPGGGQERVNPAVGERLRVRMDPLCCDPPVSSLLPGGCEESESRKEQNPGDKGLASATMVRDLSGNVL